MIYQENGEHNSGYYLDADGKAITYTHPDGLKAYIECSLDEDDNVFKYIVSIHRGRDELVCSHEFFENKEAAKSRLR